MSFGSGLALILMTQIGYASGAVVAGKGKHVFPNLLDLVVVVVLWVMALMTQTALGRGWAILAWLAAGLVVGAGLTGLRREGYPDRKKKAAPTVQSAGRLRRLWHGWKVFAAEMGNYQGRLFLAFFYFIIVTPFGIAVRLFGDPLRIRRLRGDSFWLERRSGGQGIESAREQF